MTTAFCSTSLRVLCETANTNSEKRRRKEENAGTDRLKRSRCAFWCESFFLLSTLLELFNDAIEACIKCVGELEEEKEEDSG